MPDGASIERRKMIRLMGGEVELTPARRRHGRRHRPGRGDRRAPPPAPGCRSSSTTRQPRHPAPPPRPRRSGPTPPARSMSSSAASAPAGRITGIARALKPRKPGAAGSSAVEPAKSAVLSGDEPGPHGIQGIGAGFKPAVLDLEPDRRRVRGCERGRDRRRPPLRPDGGAAGRHLLRRHAARRRCRWRRDMPAGLVVGIAPSFAERYLRPSCLRGYRKPRPGEGIPRCPLLFL